MKKKVKILIKKILPNTFGKSITRISLDIELKHLFKKLKPGFVLDVGSKNSPYLEYIPFITYTRLDVDIKSNPDICCDLHEITSSSGQFDTVIATEVLEHLYDPQKSINEIYRILKPNGTCILSTRFIYPYHPDPRDYYRFTQDSLAYLFRDFSIVEIYHHGNRLQAIWQIISDCGKIGIPLRTIFNPLIAKIRFKKTRYPCGFVVYARK